MSAFKSGRGSALVALSAEFDLSATECFPDGIPDEWDAETVLSAIRSQGLDAWNLLGFGLVVRVTASRPNPHFSQDETLLPDQAPPRWLTTTAEGIAR